MSKIKLLLAYDGSQFNGWQKQAGATVTVQGELERILSKIFDQEIKVAGAGRTDTGVHALGQIAHFTAPKPIEKYNLLTAINTQTPRAMVVHRAWVAPPEFHSMHSAIGKVYKYVIFNHPSPSALRRDHFTWLPYDIDLDYLNRVSEHIVGEHDFKSFQTSGTPVKSTVRRVWKAEWQRRGKLVEFTIEGQGFLKQMVRNLVGTMLDFHSKTRNPLEFKDILAAKDRRSAGSTAPPRGLYLMKVEYPSALDNKCRKL